ncbi:hypothetical protein [Pseudomonas coronafaciens]|uniref:Uncharacterized protein n=1 Tax=Pseudomonas coronafaciens pv. striafaciens TaxID=235276 RepID=A0A3M4YDH9_9PSED|nr:hypothetical protein [Pseudomonas coronafaciens]RMR86329.1 hypothetical protein ALP78_02119 [Pseudomonas coronafaciens pv. striafaciens]
MIVKKGEVITIASGIFESYDRAGPFVVTQDVDVEAFIADARTRLEEPWELSALLSDVPRILCEQGLLAKLPCRRIYLGSMGEVDIGEEKEEF